MISLLLDQLYGTEMSADQNARTFIHRNPVTDIRNKNEQHINFYCLLFCIYYQRPAECWLYANTYGLRWININLLKLCFTALNGQLFVPRFLRFLFDSHKLHESLMI